MQQIAKVLLSFLLCVTQINPLVVFGQEETTENQENQTESSDSNPDGVSLSKNKKQIPNSDNTSDNTKNETSLQTPDSSENSEKVPEQIIFSAEDSNENTATDQNAVQHIEFEELPVSDEVEISEVSTPVRVIVSAPKDLISSRENIVLDTENEEINNFSEITAEENDSEETLNNTGVVSYIDSISETSDESNEIINNTDIEGLKNEVENITLNPLYEENKNNEGIIIKEISDDDYAKLNNNSNSTESVQEIPSNNEINNDDSSRVIYLGSFDDVYLLQYPDMESAEVAVEYYNLYGNFASLDTMVFINQTDEVTPEEEVISETEMDLYSNPLSELENAVDNLETDNEIAETDDSIVDVESNTKSPVLIAVIDTGSNYTDYPVVSMLGDSGADVNGHGTRMIDYILEEDPSADIIAIKALGDDGKGDISAVYAGIQYAISAGADIINMSFNAFSNEENAVLKDAVVKATEAGIMVVTSAGNNNLDAKYFTPSNISDAIVIGSAVQTEEKVTKQGFSNFGESVDYYVLSDSTSEGAARYSSILSEVGQEEIDNAINTGKVFLLDENFSVTGGNIEDSDQSGEFSQNDVAITFMSGSDGKFEDGSTQNAVTYVDAPMVVKYSHTSNVDDTGKQNSNYGNSWTNANITGTDRGSTSQAHVVTIPGAGSLTVELYYNGENGFWGLSDWLSVWAGNYPSYTAASNYNSDGYVTTAMGAPDNKNKFGGSYSGSYTVNGNTLTNMGHTTLTIPGDTVTFGFKSDNSGYGQGYGYYAIVTGNRSIVSGTYKEPVANNDDYKFESWNSKADGTGTTIDIGSVTTSQTVYAKYRYDLIESGTYGCPWKLTGNGVLTIGTDGGNCTLKSPAYFPSDWPWYSNSSVKKAVIKGTVKSDKSLWGMFEQMSNMTEIEGLTNLDTSAATNMNSMFYYCSSLTSLNLSNFNTSAVTNMNYMFERCSKLTSLDLSSFNTSAVTDMSYMFDRCSSLTNLNLSNFNTSAVTNMESMFNECSALTSLDVSGFNTSSVTNMKYLYHNCSSLTSLNLSGFNTSAVTNMNFMFTDCSSLTSLDLSSFNTSAVTDMNFMFSSCSGLTSLNLSKFDTSAVTNMGYMFSYCPSLTSLDLSSFNTSAVTNMSNMFYYCSSLPSLDLSKFDTSAVTNMGYMFSNCSGLTSLNLSDFNTSAVTNMSHMFFYCSKLASLNLSSFNTSAVTDMSYMFYNSNNLNSVKLGSDFSFRGNNITDEDEYKQALLPTPSYTAPNNGKWELKDNTDMSKQYTPAQMRDTDPQTTAMGEYVWAKTIPFYVEAIDKTTIAITKVGSPAAGAAKYGIDNIFADTEYSYGDSITLMPGQRCYWEITDPRIDFNASNYLKFTSTGTIKVGGNLSSLIDNSSCIWKAYCFYGLFAFCSTLISVKDLNFESITNFYSTHAYSNMFNGCTNLVEGPAFLPVTDLKNYSYAWMFNNCKSLTKAPELPSTVLATGVYHSMFKGCSGLLEVPDLPATTVKSYAYYSMFENCTSLTVPSELPATTLDYDCYAYMFKGCTNIKLSTTQTDNYQIPYRVPTTGTGTTATNALLDMFATTGGTFTGSPSINTTYYLNDAKSVVSSGTYGCPWILTDDGTLTFGEEGTSCTLSNGTSTAADRPWNDYITNIRKVNFKGTVTANDLGYYFWGASNLLEFDTENLNTSSLTTLEGTFRECPNLKRIDLTSLNLNRLTNLWYTFYKDTGLMSVKLPSRYGASKLNYFRNCFYNCTSLRFLSIPYLNTSNVQNLSGVFYSCKLLPSIDFTIDTSSATTLYLLFYDCNALYYSDFSKFNTSKVTDFSWMFCRCYNMDINTSTFTGEKATTLASMFLGCNSKLTKVDLSNFTTTNVTDFNQMFYGCTKLRNINIENFDTSAATTLKNMFYNCTNLTSIKLGSNFSFTGNSSITDTTLYAVLPEPSSTSPFSGKWIKKGEQDHTNSYTSAQMQSLNPQMTNPGIYTWDSIVDPSFMFVDGVSFNTAVKTLINRSYTADSLDTLVTGFQRVQSVDLSKDIIDVSLAQDDSILMWLDGTTIKWTSVPASADLVLNQSSQFMFNKFSALENINMSDFGDASYVQNAKCMFQMCPSIKTIIGLNTWDTGNLTNTDYMFLNCSNLETITGINSWDVSNVTTMNSMFYNCEKLGSINISNWDTSNVTDMTQTFANCSSLSSIGNLDAWETGNVTNMTGMFLNCSNLETIGDLSDWDTSKVTNMKNMFYNCSKVESIGALNNWETDNVTNMSNMFGLCKSLVSVGNLGNWNTSSVTDMSGMFNECSSLTTIGNLNNWNTSSVTTMRAMFQLCKVLETVGDLSGWSTGNVTDMCAMFNECNSLLTTGNLDAWDTSKVTDMSFMFEGCQALTNIGDLSNWNTGEVSTMLNMFERCYLLAAIGNLSSWDTGKVTSMGGMFQHCRSLTNIGNLQNWDISQVTTTECMFNDCALLSYIGELDDWDTSKITSMNGMFQACTSLPSVGDLSSWNTSNVIDMSHLFQNCESLETPGDLDNWETGNVTNMYAMFGTCTELSDIGDISGWDVSKVEDMSYMFQSCSSLETIGDLDNWDTENVRTMYAMFDRSNLSSVGDLSNWDTANVETMKAMFNHCSSLLSIGDISEWNTGKVTDMFGMFTSCSKITSLGDLSDWDVSNVEDMGFMFADCENLETLQMDNWETTSLTNMKMMFGEMKAIETIDISSFNTVNVTDMNSLFKDSTSLKTITGLNSFDTSNVTDMSYMFASTNDNEQMALESLDLSSFDTSSADNMSGMFRNTKNIVSIELSEDFSFKGNSISQTNKQALLSSPSEYGYWELDGNTDSAEHYSSLQMRSVEPQLTAPGEYVWVNGNTITFMANGGSGTMDPQVISEPSTLNTNTFIAPTGYTFGGWATSVANATVGTVAYTDGGNITPSGNITLYSIWKKNITFYSGNNKTTATIVEQYYDGANLTGSNITTPSATTCENISRWTELGWRDDTTAGAKEVDFNISISPTSTDYYAVYSRDLTLSYNGNGNTGGSAPANGTFNQRYNTNGAITSPAFTLANNTFTKTRYIFNDWDLGTPGTTYTAWNPAVSDTTVTKTAYAQWLRQDNVSVNCQVSGNMGSKDKLFTYTVAFTNTDTPYENQTINYTLNGSARTLTLDSSARGTIELNTNDTATFQGILEGTTFTITQQNYATDGYNVNHLSVTETLSNTDYNVTFTNENAVAVPTGITSFHSLVGTSICGIGLLGIILFLFKRKKLKQN